MQWHFVVFACFLGGTPLAYQLKNTVKDLKVEVVALGRTLRQGFFILRMKKIEVVQALSLLTPW